MWIALLLLLDRKRCVQQFEGGGERGGAGRSGGSEWWWVLVGCDRGRERKKERKKERENEIERAKQRKRERERERERKLGFFFFFLNHLKYFAPRRRGNCAGGYACSDGDGGREQGEVCRWFARNMQPVGGTGGNGAIWTRSIWQNVRHQLRRREKSRWTMK